MLTLDSGLNMPNGVAFRDGDLYVAEVNRVLRYDDIEARLDAPPEPVVVNDEFPSDRAQRLEVHRVRAGRGASTCRSARRATVCDHEATTPIYSTINSMNADGSDLRIYAHGIRNTVGFSWHPETEELWFTNNGRDRLGDTQPADTLHHAPEPGLHFGFPFCHQGDIQDPEFDTRPCSEFRPPARKLGPHVASLGMRFYTGDMFSAEYRNQIFIAEHGSWNRTPEAGHTGYRLTVAKLDGDQVTDYEVFAEGLLNEDNTWWGRPRRRAR